MERMYRNLNDRVIRRRRQRFEPCCAELLVGGKRKIKRKYVQDVIIDDERDNELLALKIQPRRSTLNEIFFRYLIPRRMLRHRSKDFRQRAIPSHTDNVDMSANANSILDATRALLVPTTLRLILLESFPRNAVRPAPSLEFPARSWYAVKTGVHTRARTRTGSVRRRHSDQRFPRGGKDGCILVSLFSVRTNLPPSAPLSSSLPKRFIRTKAGNTDADGNIQAAFLRIGPSLCENAKWSPGVPLSVGYAIA